MQGVFPCVQTSVAVTFFCNPRSCTKQLQWSEIVKYYSYAEYISCFFVLSALQTESSCMIVDHLLQV
jgi:hypothetical protein